MLRYGSITGKPLGCRVHELDTLVTVVNATVYRVYEYAVPVTTVATVPSAAPLGATAPIAGAYGAPYGAAYGAPYGATPFAYGPHGYW